MRGWFLAVNVVVTNSNANATKSIANRMNSTAKITNSTANGTKSIAKSDEFNCKTCNPMLPNIYAFLTSH